MIKNHGLRLLCMSICMVLEQLGRLEKPREASSCSRVLLEVVLHDREINQIFSPKRNIRRTSVCWHDEQCL